MRRHGEPFEHVHIHLLLEFKDLTKKYLQIASSRVNGDETALEGPFLQICVADAEDGEDGGFVKKCCPEGEIIRPDLNKCVRVS